MATKRTGTEIKPSLHHIQGPYDVITLWHVLEHVTDLNGTIEQLRKILAENGTIFIALPNLNSPDASNYKQHWAAYDVPRHLWHFSRKTLHMLLSKHQLKLTTTIPMRLDAFYVSLLSQKYLEGTNSLSAMTRAVAQGWKSNHLARQTQEYSSLIYIASK